MKKFLILGMVLVILVVLLKFMPSVPVSTIKESLEVGNTVIQIEIADTPEELIQGLSGRNGLEEGEGMLFVFDQSAKHGFWMKDMSFSIDIIWIAENGEIVGIERAVSPSTYPKVFYPPSDVKFVLEVKEGFSNEAKINVGDILSIGQ